MRPLTASFLSLFCVFDDFVAALFIVFDLCYVADKRVPTNLFVEAVAVRRLRQQSLRPFGQTQSVGRTARRAIGRTIIGAVRPSFRCVVCVWRRRSSDDPVSAVC